MTPPPGWQFFVDRGGTFTDIVAVRPDGQILTHKLLSQNAAQYDDAALAGIERLLSEGSDEPQSISSIRMGTTIGTNALLERRGADTVLVVTQGFADILRIGSQQRPDIFALAIELPEMLYARCIEASERIAADGTILEPLDEGRLAEALAAARGSGMTSVAIVLLNAYRNPAHEHDAARIARAAGFDHVSVSTDINPTIKLVDRGDTAVVDAYLTPVLDAYKSQLGESLGGRLAGEQLQFMQSHGGLVEAGRFRGVDSVLSGPAGGVVGMATTSRDAGFEHVIGFDMGGTSTDVSVFAGRFERSAGDRIAGCRIARPMLRINTVAAGGGSVLKFSGGRLQVGPESAGAFPGPVCYRNGGPLTLTDANVLLGRIHPDYFPRVFGPNADQAIDRGAVQDAFDRLAAAVAAEGGASMTVEELAEGCLKIAIANMAQAIEQISVQRGHDPTRYALACFGGAGGQHACGVADALGVETILIHPLSGVLSAYGIGVAEQRSIAAAGIHAELDATSLALAKDAAARLAAELRAELGAAAAIESRAFLRVAGSDTLLDLAFSETTPVADLRRAFAAVHEQRFGFAARDAVLMLQSVEVEAIVAGVRPAQTRPPRHDGTGHRHVTQAVRFAGRWVETPVLSRRSLGAGATVAGPAMITEDNATIIVEADWSAAVEHDGMLVLRRVRPRPGREPTATGADPIMLEIFNNQFMHIAEQMGAVLEQTAHSVNIKERLDYSCALFDRGGELIANAPHVPVHLGSMGDSVREVIRVASELRPGDAYMLNAPYRGGTHLPDITVVSPVFAGPDAEPGFFVASRAHHADIGGITPGSMPAFSRTLEEEGVVIEATQILKDGELLQDTILDLLASGPHPARNPAQNLADLKAQLAANAMGRIGIENLLERYGDAVVHAYMKHVRSNAAACTRAALRKLHDGRFTARMDDGAPIAVAVHIDRATGRALIDFSGSAELSGGNLNAPRSVVRAVVLYVLRTLVRENIPLNAGCLEPIELMIPENSLLDPKPPAAVAGGNVETSQCICDALLAALDALAASQGTMNNFTFGDAEHQYYETICGGCGAGPGFAGASAVHSHMTNSRLTDVEVLEQRFPVRVVRFAIRHGSGGKGRWPGGDGVVRELEFLAPMQLSLLAGRRRERPFGLAGGGAGAAGRDTIVRRTGQREILTGISETAVQAGDRIVIETPGGGGYGTPVPDRKPLS